MTSRIACSCPDWRFHGSNLSRERMLNKARLAEGVIVMPTPGRYKAQSGEEIHHVALEEAGDLDRLCKHCVAVLWHESIPLFLVEYKDRDWGIPDPEIRAEAYWGNESAMAAIMADGEVLAITKLERTNDDE